MPILKRCLRSSYNTRQYDPLYIDNIYDTLDREETMSTWADISIKQPKDAAFPAGLKIKYFN